jgi:hypothetical protein
MKDLGDYLDKLFDPELKKLKDLHEQLKQNIKCGIIEDLMKATTIAEIDEIEARNEDCIKMWPELLVHVRSARKRVKNIILTYIDIMGLETLN